MDYIKYIRSKVGNDKIILLAAACIIEKEGKILLQHRSDNKKWGLPGGCMEMDETVTSCAKREVYEETGLIVELKELIGVYNNFNMLWPSNDLAHVICFVFKATPLNNDLKIDEESLELKYFSKEDMPIVDAIDHKKAIDDYFKNITNHIE